MKKFTLAAAALAALAAPAANALTISATLDSFTSRSATVAGVGSGGGIGSFTVTSAPAATGDGLLDDLFANGNQFLAYCLEPDETIGTRTYDFSIVDLADAPSSPSSGPVGALGALWVERFLSTTPYDTVDELVAGATVSEETAFQAMLYEAAYESPAAASFALNLGAAVVTAAGASAADLAAIAMAANNALLDPTLADISAYGLINQGLTGAPATRTQYRGQDFMVFTRTTAVPSPAPLALLGLGLAGLGYTRLRK